MAVRTVAQSGLYSATSTWVGGIKPVVGDTVVNTGFDVTQDENAELGTGTGDCITCSGGSWKLNANLILTIHGDITLTSCPLDVENGATITNPDNAAYQIVVGTTNDVTNNIVAFQGTSGNRVQVTCTGGANSKITFPRTTLGCCQVHARYTTFKDCQGVTDAEDERIMRPAMSAPGFLFDLENVEFNNCGAIIVPSNMHVDSTFRLNKVTFRNSTGQYNIYLRVGAALGSGVREMKNMVFDKEQFLSAFLNFDCDNWVTRERWQIGVGHDFSSPIKNVVTYKPNPGSGQRHAETAMENIYWVSDSTDINPHGFGALSQGGTYEVKRVYWEFTANGATDGDMFTHGVTPPAAQTVTYTRCISLRTPNGTSPGVMFGYTQMPAEVAPTFRRNTSFGRMLRIGETNPPVANAVKGFSGNLCYNTTAAVSKAFDSDGTVANAMPASVVQDNCGFLMAAGSNGNGYNGFNDPTGTLGDNDKDNDPTWVIQPTTAGILAWDQSLGGDGTLTGVLDRLSKMNDDDFDIRYTPQALMAFTDDRHRPGNEALRGAAQGEDIGAVDMAAPQQLGNLPVIGGRNPLIS